ncbi:hypothetical protein [Cohnella sp. AR92]|uniref:hypothetical protein n=1 Tax=Cohnella sp. AR92 TaxID=648716 RepID=UPI000F8F50E3|nr:hypothetical protein [Cohnella sp. AR92]RUS49012.1 hypothetical protein ELR57_01310 [Cohnella sp. AR92]
MKMIERYRSELERIYALAEEEVRTMPAGLDVHARLLLNRSNPLLNGGKANLISYLLPYWVGEKLNAPVESCRDLAVGNLYMMLHFFVLDDAIDDDAGWTDEERRRVIPLGQLLQSLYLRLYLARFGAESPIWAHLRGYMEQWAAAMSREAEERSDPRNYRALAAKAAPIKLCAAALLLEAGLDERIPDMDEAIDLALATLQLADDLSDWRDDLAEPDGNAFLTLTRELLNASDETVLDTRAVQRAIYHRDGIGRLAGLAEELGEKLVSIEDCPLRLLEYQRSIAQELRTAASDTEEQVNLLLRGDRLASLLSNSVST